ncbi:hypothetical protein CHUAL_007617 [Chamberlinius hualienensis]|uniref:Cytochrome P450 3200C6 n=1 Tax=Chamberlinius hualienensis TaxID=1551368 RepID=A0A1J1E1J9_9MYRI|nr:cytochrome P450 3200C6 [Chamberlinius hualienensis]
MWTFYLAILLIVLAYWYISTPKNAPPGPRGLPILGYLPFLDKNAHLTFVKLGKIYGNVFRVYFGSRLVVVLNDYDAIHEAFVKNAEIFAGRPPDINFKEKPEDNLGVISNDGVFWKQHRRFILTNLRDYGVGKLALEPMLLTELHHFIEVVKTKNGESFAVKQLLNNSLTNNINILVTGKRYEYDDPTMIKMLQLFRKAEMLFPVLTVFALFPWLSKLPGADIILKKKQIKELIATFLSIVGDTIQQVKVDYKDGQQSNYIHAYLTERLSRLQADASDNIFSDEALVHIVRDLLVAGTETTATSLHWGLFYMTLNPEVQRKVQDEIDRVIGQERDPSYNDRTQLPYTEATIMEIHRMVSLVPLSIAHRNTKEVFIQNYRIPKDTMIIPNLWAVHRDPKIWGDPENFRPERFIGMNGQVMKNDHLIPFSMGKRACAGEPLARMEMFLYFVSLLQNFTFVPPDGKMPTLEYYPGFVRRPIFQLVCAKPRK